MAPITLRASEGALLTTVATIAAGIASGDVGTFSPTVRLIAGGVVAGCAYLGYAAYAPAAA